MEPDDDDLELAFQLHVMNQLAEADLNATQDERVFLDRHFPLQDLVAAGFKTPAGAWTDAYDEAAVQALAVLPKRLAHAAKLDLLEACYKLAIADGEFKMGEGAVILMAARLLDLSDDDFDHFVERSGGPPGMTAAELDREL
jgi:uncharacterized tellurite resistance protein B-like protein